MYRRLGSQNQDEIKENYPYMTVMSARSSNDMSILNNQNNKVYPFNNEQYSKEA